MAEGSPAADAAAAWWVLDVIPDGVAIFDRDWTIVYLNAAGAAVLDRSAAELRGTNIWEVFPEAVGTEFHSCLLEAAAGTGPVRWRAYYGPVQGWFTDTAQRVGEYVAVVYTRADDATEAEATRQRLTGEVAAALARAELLLAASEAFTAATTVTDVADAVAGLASGGLAPTYVDIALLEPGGAHLRRLRPDTLPEQIRERYRRVRVEAEQPVAECVRTGKPVFVEDLDQLAARYPALHAEWAAVDRQAMAAAPLHGIDGVLGALVFVWPRPHPLTEHERAVITALAGYSAQALQRALLAAERLAAAEARYEDTRAAVLSMQRSLLTDLPVLPEVDVAALYAPADLDLAAGGDWYDVVTFPDGRVALVVGDVVGHGASATAAMAQLLAVGRHLLGGGAGPVEALAGLDALARGSPGARAATVCVAVLDPATGELTWAGAGHPPPLRVHADGAVTVLTGGGGAPLGTTGRAGPTVARTLRLAPGDLLVLYTDGLVERAGRGLDAGVADLAAAAGAVHGEGAPTRVCALAAARLDADGQRDDVTVLAAGRRVPVEPLRFEVTAAPAELRRARRVLGGWLDGLELGDADRDAVELAVSEAVTNAVEHAYRGGPGTVAGVGGVDRPSVTVHGELDAQGRCVLGVSDRGRWRPPDVDPDSRGRGLQMMRATMDGVELRTTGDGTTVTMWRTLCRPAVFLADAPATPRPAARTEVEYAATVLRAERPTLRLTGPLDLTTADLLRRDLLGAARGGALPLTVDLTDVTLLASAAVQVLHDLAAPLRLRLDAAPGTPAAAVLELTGLVTPDGDIAPTSGARTSP